MLGKSISCRSHAAFGDIAAPPFLNGWCLFAAGRRFIATLIWAHSRRNLLDGSSRLTILQQPVTFHFLKWTVTSSLLTVEDRVPARHGKGWLHTPRSSFKKARFQLSCFSLQGCWHTELRVIFNHQNGGNVPLNWISVLSVVPPTAAPCREVHGDEGRGRHSWLYKVFLGFLSQITTLCHHRSQLLQSPLSSHRIKMWELSKPAMSDKAMPDGFSDR